MTVPVSPSGSIPPHSISLRRFEPMMDRASGTPVRSGNRTKVSLGRGYGSSAAAREYHREDDSELALRTDRGRVDEVTVTAGHLERERPELRNLADGHVERKGPLVAVGRLVIVRGLAVHAESHAARPRVCDERLQDRLVHVGTV